MHKPVLGGSGEKVPVRRPLLTFLLHECSAANWAQVHANHEGGKLKRDDRVHSNSREDKMAFIVLQTV